MRGAVSFRRVLGGAFSSTWTGAMRRLPDLRCPTKSVQSIARQEDPNCGEHRTDDDGESEDSCEVGSNNRDDAKEPRYHRQVRRQLAEISLQHHQANDQIP